VESQKERDLLPRCKLEDNIKLDLREEDGIWTGLIWLKIGTNGGLL
jgi:hypothetical protein